MLLRKISPHAQNRRTIPPSNPRARVQDSSLSFSPKIPSGSKTSSISPKTQPTHQSKPQSPPKPQLTQQPKPQMALTIHLLHPQIPPYPFNFQTHPLTHLRSRAKPPKISCTKTSKSSDFSSELLVKEVEKINTQLAQREEAMKKSRNLLFSELSKYLGLRTEELKMRLREMEEEDKWVLVRGFVSEWGVDFHPLSARSVKEMVEEHLTEDNPPPPPVASTSDFFPGLKKMIGF